MKKIAGTLIASTLFTGLVHANPLDFLTVEQRLHMMNSFLAEQDAMRDKPGNGSRPPPLTMEQRIKLVEWFLATQAPAPSTANPGAAAFSPAAPQPLAAAPAHVPATPLPVNTGMHSHGTAIGDAELAAVFSKWPTLASGVKFERFRDGFAIDGKRYLDPEGAIAAYGFDAQSGDFTYLAHNSQGQYILKTGRAGTSAEPVEIAKAEKRGGQWTVTTATGKKLAGYRLIPLARGFIVARENTGFRYVAGQGTTSFAAPEQFAIAALQSGNVSGTGYLLLERVPEDNPNSGAGTLGGLFNAVQALGSTLGINKKEDYALLNIDSGKLVPINVSFEDKRVQFMSACRQRNFVFAECEHMDSYESLFQPNGMRNMSHYFWRINWFNAAGRPILVSQEGGLSQVTATDLGSGKKATLFERAMGIAAFTVTQHADGKISVSATMGFNTESKDDVVALLDAAPAAAKNADKQPPASTPGLPD